MSDVDIEGLDKLLATLARMGGKAAQVCAPALVDEAERIMLTARERTPVDTGLLESTGQVGQPKISRDEVSVEMGFGTDYAIYVHENLDAHHPTGQAKFLESALEDADQGMGERLGRDIEAEIAEQFGNP